MTAPDLSPVTIRALVDRLLRMDHEMTTTLAREAAATLRALAAEREAGDWQPIATAPLGKRVLVGFWVEFAGNLQWFSHWRDIRAPSDREGQDGVYWHPLTPTPPAPGGPHE